MVVSSVWKLRFTRLCACAAADVTCAFRLLRAGASFCRICCEALKYDPSCETPLSWRGPHGQTARFLMRWRSDSGAHSDRFVLRANSGNCHEKPGRLESGSMPLDDGSMARGWALRGRAFRLIRTVPVGIFAVRVRRASGGGYRSLNKPYMAIYPAFRTAARIRSGLVARPCASPPPAEDDHPRLQAAPSPWLDPYAADAPTGLIGAECPRPPQLSPAR